MRGKNKSVLSFAGGRSPCQHFHIRNPCLVPSLVLALPCPGDMSPPLCCSSSCSCWEFSSGLGRSQFPFLPSFSCPSMPCPWNLPPPIIRKEHTPSCLHPLGCSFCDWPGAPRLGWTYLDQEDGRGQKERTCVLRGRPVAPEQLLLFLLNGALHLPLWSLFSQLPTQHLPLPCSLWVFDLLSLLGPQPLSKAARNRGHPEYVSKVGDGLGSVVKGCPWGLSIHCAPPFNMLPMLPLFSHLKKEKRLSPSLTWAFRQCGWVLGESVLILGVSYLHLFYYIQMGRWETFVGGPEITECMSERVPVNTKFTTVKNLGNSPPPHFTCPPEPCQSRRTS